MARLILNLFVLILMIIYGESLNCLNEKWIEESLNKSHIPGAVIIVVNATDILYEQAFGYHSLFPPRFMDAKNSIFSIASISKTFVGTAVMQLVEEERIDLDTDINQYLKEPHYRIFHPNYPSHSITLRRLLSHSSSIAVDEYLQLSLYQPGDFAFQQSTLADRLFNNLNSNKSSWLPKPPGSVTFYSNDGSSLAGLVVERVANMSFDKYVKEKMMKPLNIDISKVGVRLSDFENREELVKHYVYALNASILNEWIQGMPQLNVTPLQVIIQIYNC
jgi:CubicO group peptidase (beta-lactamase class C family)